MGMTPKGMMMTKTEKLAVAEHLRSIASRMTYNGSDSEASAKHQLYEQAMFLTIQAHTQTSPTIAQSIRDAAIHWPQFLGNVECQVIDAFCFTDCFRFRDDLMHGNQKEKTQARTFMLLVAEALE